ncbi:DUF6445 family protein [Sphingomonas kyungheensis]|uniref:DUF6445 family protein n=1 Tax=Sphingomonas kyungheensis TaxID=1069987 RepID=A0ABU8H7Y7_9SPHN
MRKPAGGDGTAFYKHRRTGFEWLDAARAPIYSGQRDAELRHHGRPPAGYLFGSARVFEQIAHIEAHYNRALLYRSASLHSEAIGPDVPNRRNPASATNCKRVTGGVSSVRLIVRPRVSRARHGDSLSVGNETPYQIAPEPAGPRAAGAPKLAPAWKIAIGPRFAMRPVVGGVQRPALRRSSGRPVGLIGFP